MADEDVLSDEEIEALLDEGEDAPSGAEDEGEGLDPDRIESVYGDISESIEKILTTILNREVSNRLIRSEIQDRQSLQENLPDNRWVVVTSSLGGEVEGLARYFLPQDNALLLADVMMGQEGEDPPEEFDEVYMSAIVEMFNQVVNSLADNLKQLTGVSIDLEPPEGEVHSTEELVDVFEEDEFLWVEYDLSVSGLVDSGVLFEVQPLSAARAISDTGGEESDEQPESPEEAETDQGEATAAGEPAGQAPGPTAQPQGGGKKDVKSVEFPQFDTSEGEKPVGNLNMLMDVPMEVAVELGRTTLQVKEILNLGQGSIIELERLAGEPVDLLVNGRLVARGEVVVIDENFGVRVTSIVSPMERIK